MYALLLKINGKKHNGTCTHQNNIMRAPEKQRISIKYFQRSRII